MSLVELLVYIVIFGILSTGLFSIIQIIQDMNASNLKQQEAFNDFNIALLSLDQFVSNAEMIHVTPYCLDNNNQESQQSLRERRRED